MKRGLWAGRDDGSEVCRMAGSRTRVERNGRKERVGHVVLEELSANEKAFVSAAHVELDAVRRDAGTAHPLIKKPFHGLTAFEVHGFRHDRFDLVLEVFGR